MALDGDADRLQMVDATGRLFNGDELLYLMVGRSAAWAATSMCPAWWARS